jgi:FAD/FMN-containing dehydrogenase
MTVVTTTGRVLVANEAQNQDLFWALRGGGAGQYGVVTEYVIKHHPAPRNVIMANIQIKPQGSTNASMEASWSAAATWLSAMPDLMDAGLAGAATVAVGSTAPAFFPDIDVSSGPFTGIAVNQVFWAFNTTPAAVEALVQPILTKLVSECNTTSSTTTNTSSLITTAMTTSSFSNYTAFFSAISGDNVAGGESLTSSRLLGRPELTHTPHSKIVSYLKTAMASQNTTNPGNYATIGLSGGPGVHSAPSTHWGALHPGWRSAYLHFIATGAAVDSKTAGSAKKALRIGADWHAAVKEPMWQEWAPGSGAYMNEANPFVDGFQEVFYGGAENYSRLQEVKRKYDPSASLYVLAGVGTERWEYDLDSGRLCRF